MNRDVGSIILDHVYMIHCLEHCILERRLLQAPREKQLSESVVIKSSSHDNES